VPVRGPDSFLPHTHRDAYFSALNEWLHAINPRIKYYSKTIRLRRFPS
jgi:hypothetical protein